MEEMQNDVSADLFARGEREGLFGPDLDDRQAIALMVGPLDLRRAHQRGAAQQRPGRRRARAASWPVCPADRRDLRTRTAPACRTYAPAMTDTIDRDALREPSTGRSATSACAPTATSSTSSRPAGSPTSSTTRTCRRVEREPLPDEVTVALIGGGFAGLVTGARLKQAGIDDVRIIEGGGDVGGAWYWNRYPGAMCDTAAMVYLPLLEETGHMPSAEVRLRARDLRARQAHRHARSACTTTRCSPPRSPSSSGTTPPSRWIIRTDRGDAIRAQFVAHGHRPAAPAEAARHPRHRDVRRALLPHQPLGLRATPAATYEGAPMTEPRRQAGRHHRHRRHGGAVHPAARPRLEGAVRVPAHAVVDRRPQQPPHRPRVVRHARARAGSRSG